MDSHKKLVFQKSPSLKIRVYMNNPHFMQELKDALLREVANIPRQVLHPMLRNFQKVLGVLKSWRLVLFDEIWYAELQEEQHTWNFVRKTHL